MFSSKKMEHVKFLKEGRECRNVDNLKITYVIIL